MSFSTITYALVNYVECHLENMNLKKMAESFGFSEIYLRELFYRNVNIPIMQYYKRRKMIASAFELLHSDKKVLTIALESGFSNPESYTRAFKKFFGMTPSRFRLERPLIVRRQLEAGVFSLECLNKRSDDIMLKENKHNTILYGIRKIEFGAYGSETAFPICVKAVSEYLGEDVSYAYIMAATGAAFRLVWNQDEWDLSNVDIYHALRESNDIYRYGANALGREFSFLERKEGTSRKEFIDLMKDTIAKGYPVIALGIIGPPEPCIVAGFESDGDVVMGWNFFQNDPQFATAVETMDNGYFRCGAWWENTDTQAVMCMGEKKQTPYTDKEIVKIALQVMEAREENTYAKGIRAYQAWKDMILQEKWFENGSTYDNMFSKLFVQNDAMTCLHDGRKWAAKYFEELGNQYEDSIKTFCMDIAGSFDKVSAIAGDMKSLIGDWNDAEKMQKNFADHSIREKLGELIDAAEKEDRLAYEKMKLFYNSMQDPNTNLDEVK